MKHQRHITYLPHDKIDKIKWDACLDRSANGLIYGYAYYLDRMAMHWDALVLNDYEAVMPLTWNKKYGIAYLYQPAFTASLGVFGEQIYNELTKDFIDAIPQKFKLVEIGLNASNKIPSGSTDYAEHRNYTLPLTPVYDKLTTGYNENTKRNIAKAQKSGYLFQKDISLGDLIALSKPFMQNLTNIKDSDYKNFSDLYYFLHQRNQAHTYGICNADHKLIASCVFFFSNGRAYYILVGNHPDGKNSGASHYLIDRFIHEHAAQDLLLDFEGSDIPTIARFYSGFGASVETYPFLKLNRLPFWMRWIM